eukprot:761953-Hanusia_phi.AAC.3
MMPGLGVLRLLSQSPSGTSRRDCPALARSVTVPYAAAASLRRDSAAGDPPGRRRGPGGPTLVRPHPISCCGAFTTNPTQPRP